MKTIVMVIAASVLGLLGGGGAGLFLKGPPPPEPETAADPAQPQPDIAGSNEPPPPPENAVSSDMAEMTDADDEDQPKRDFVKLEKQFVVPVLEDERVSSLVVLSLAIEVDEGATDVVFSREPKLRDAFLQALFTHAQSRGFDGAFTARHRLDDLRRALVAAARDVLGGMAHNVLLTNIVRQDI